ncbi:hypothetical protein QFC19_008710 [Naganishia cerealis]|uniref:Uncharacterized protein n=1 Tax=Naganishia cerealis TaxID=610337 RepID=A0ACC2UZT7_9TREE|nr:hypothetical protein QFC19_008710 [Naganishia cerealis]
MSLDDLAAAAWADDASPGNSPKLSEQDIWGAPRLQRGDEAEDAGLQQEVPLGIVAETPSSEKDVWNSGEGEAAVSLSTDITPEPSQEATSDTDNPRNSKNESGIPGNTAPAPLEDAKSVAIPAARESGVAIAEPTTQIPAVNNENEDEDEGFDNFDDQPFATPSSAFPAAGPPCDDEKTALESNQDDFGDFGDFEDFDDAAVQNPGADAFGSESRDVVGLGGEFTDEPEESVWDDPDRPPPLVSAFPLFRAIDKITTIPSSASF